MNDWHERFSSLPVSIVRESEKIAVPLPGAYWNYATLKSDLLPVRDVTAPVEMKQVQRKIIQLRRDKEEWGDRTRYSETRYYVLDDDWLEEVWFNMDRERRDWAERFGRLSAQLDKIRAMKWGARLRFLITGKLPNNRHK